MVPQVVTNVHLLHLSVLLFHFCEDLLGGQKMETMLIFDTCVVVVGEVVGSE